MPSHRVHRRIDKVFLGREYPEVHRWMDKPYTVLGRRHRILRHDPLSILYLALINPRYGASALLHVLADYSYTTMKKYKRGKRRK